MSKRASSTRSPAAAKKNRNGADGSPKFDGKVLERGLIYFFYRPKLDVATATELADVHHLYILLAPGVDESGAVEATGHKKRLLVVEHNKLPHVESGPLPKARSVAWCHVDTVSHQMRKIAQVLNAESIATMKDAKKHTVEPARAVAEGFYVIADLNGHTHLAYTLAEPKTIGRVQDAFHIDTEAAYLLTVRNPISAPQRVEGAAKSFPPYLMELFETSPPSKQPREWIPLMPTDFLDHEGIELCLVGVAKDVELDLGSLGVDLKMLEASGGRPLLHDALRNELQLSAKGKRVAPLRTGEWA